MVSAIVTEENIFKSQQNIRTDFTKIRKAVAAENVTETSRSLETNKSFSLDNILSYIHIHSDNDVQIILTKGNTSITLVTQLLTIQESFDSIVITNNGDSTTQIYVVFA